AGTPTVSTGIGVEGLALRHGRHVLVADAPDAFAAGITRLLTTPSLWRALSRQGRTHIARSHRREVVRRTLTRAVDAVLAKDVKATRPTRVAWRAEDATALEYHDHLVPRIRELVARLVPSDATVLVVSKGDAELVRLNGPRAWHFPRGDDGVY